jgi:dCMP deaminase
MIETLFGPVADVTVEEKWHDHMLRAYQMAVNSPDPSTQNGAVLVNSKGLIVSEACNDFPMGVKSTLERWERPLKYQFVCHAEAAAIYMAAKHGVKTNGLTMVCQWAACARCAISIIQAGIVRLVTHKQAHERSPEMWKKEIEVAFTMFKEVGVEVVFYDGVVGGPEVRHSGHIWKP